MSKEKEEKQEKPYWEGKEYSFYSHKKCEFFPCHVSAVPESVKWVWC